MLRMTSADMSKEGSAGSAGGSSSFWNSGSSSAKEKFKVLNEEKGTGAGAPREEGPKRSEARAGGEEPNEKGLKEDDRGGDAPNRSAARPPKRSDARSAV